MVSLNIDNNINSQPVINSLFQPRSIITEYILKTNHYFLSCRSLKNLIYKITYDRFSEHDCKRVNIVEKVD